MARGGCSEGRGLARKATSLWMCNLSVSPQNWNSYQLTSLNWHSFLSFIWITWNHNENVQNSILKNSEKSHPSIIICTVVSGILSDSGVENLNQLPISLPHSIGWLYSLNFPKGRVMFCKDREPDYSHSYLDLNTKKLVLDYSASSSWFCNKGTPGWLTTVSKHSLETGLSSPRFQILDRRPLRPGHRAERHNSGAEAQRSLILKTKWFISWDIQSSEHCWF